MNLLEKAKAYRENLTNGENSIAGFARLIPLICAVGGVNTTWVGLAHENGRLYKFKSSQNRGSIAGKLRNRALGSRDGVQVEVDANGIVYYERGNGNRRRIGEILDYNGRGYDVTLSVKDDVTGERRQRDFPSILLVNEDLDGDLRVTATFGQSTLKEFAAAAEQGDEGAIKKVLNFLRLAYPNDFEVDLENAAIEPITPEGMAFYDELELLLEQGTAGDGEEDSAEPANVSQSAVGVEYE